MKRKGFLFLIAIFSVLTLLIPASYADTDTADTDDDISFIQTFDGSWRMTRNGENDYITNDIIHCTIHGKTGWYYIVYGKVDFDYTGISNFSNAYGWWYINDGMVDFTFTGTASNNNGTWYAENGFVDFSNEFNVQTLAEIQKNNKEPLSALFWMVCILGIIILGPIIAIFIIATVWDIHSTIQMRKKKG